MLHCSTPNNLMEPRTHLIPARSDKSDRDQPVVRVTSAPKQSVTWIGYLYYPCPSVVKIRIQSDHLGVLASWRLNPFYACDTTPDTSNSKKQFTTNFPTHSRPGGNFWE